MSDDSERLAWLHGWERSEDGLSVYTFGSTHCVGCGRWDGGLAAIALSDDDPPLPADPDWPFPEDACPVCRLRPYYLDAGDEPRAASIVRDLTAADGVAGLRDIRARARQWVSDNPAVSGDQEGTTDV